MAAAVTALADESDWRAAGDDAHAQAAAAFNLTRVCEAGLARSWNKHAGIRRRRKRRCGMPWRKETC